MKEILLNADLTKSCKSAYKCLILVNRCQIWNQHVRKPLSTEGRNRYTEIGKKTGGGLGSNKPGFQKSGYGLIDSSYNGGRNQIVGGLEGLRPSAADRCVGVLLNQFRQKIFF